MTNEYYKYIYGPVDSWRLGKSLGVDLISTEGKTCSFNCLYCQLGRKGELSKERKIYVSTEDVISEFKNINLDKKSIDYITFSGMGEPTLAENLGEVIKKVKKISENKIPVAVLTNSSLINYDSVKKDLKLADFVMFKLDASVDKVFRKINKPVTGISFMDILTGIKQFSVNYEGKIALQIMFIEENKHLAKEIAEISTSISPDEIQINTPLRPSLVNPLEKKDITLIKKEFTVKGLKIKTAYDEASDMTGNSSVKRRRPNK